ncbi:hypothetical protein K8I31_16310 [bacterium]|nr:hypothetical protein [bacterium]
MSDLRAYVANFLGGGHEITWYGEHWIRDSLSFKCDGFTFMFIQKQEIVTGKLDDFKGFFTKSSEVLVKDVSKNDVEKVLKALSRICWLLSFAGLSQVLCYAHEYPDGSGCGKRISVVGQVSYFRPSIDIRNGEQTIKFIEKTYDGYKKLEKTRKLNVVIDYLVHAEKIGQPIELKLLIAFVVLENLKDTYARSMKIPYEKGYFRKIPKPCKGDNRYSFEELLRLMLSKVKMRKGLKRIINLRNEIIHSGIVRKSHAWQWKQYDKLHDLLREYILRLIGFNGYYLTYASASRNRKNLVQ